MRASLAILRGVAGPAVLAAGLAGCAAWPRLPPVTINPGCYAVSVDSLPRAVVGATGLRDLPSFVGLDTAVAGPLGRRVILPAAWRDAPPIGRAAFWTEVPHGDRLSSLLVTFRGPAGAFEVTLEASDEGYAGTGARRDAGGTHPPQVRVSFVAVSCRGLRLGAGALEP